MRIMFITPRSKYARERWLPLGLGYISSILKKDGHDVVLYDRFLRGYQLDGGMSLDEDMKQAIAAFTPDIIGLSTVSPLIHDTVHCTEYIREFYNGIIIAGGHHVTAMPELTLKKMPGLDLAAAGESESTMLALAQGRKPGEVPGLFSREYRPPENSISYIKDLDRLPPPDHSIFDMDYYTAANHYTIKGFYLRTACVLSARGCPNNCEFCSESMTFGRGIRFHSPGYVADIIGRLITDYGVEGIYFHDNNFLASPGHAEGLCRELIRSGLSKKVKWEIQTGTPTINEEMLKLLREAGCIKIELGIESARDKDLRAMNKNADIDINSRAMHLCHEYGIAVHTNFMTGFEGETVEDLDDKVRWIRQYKPHTFSFHPIKVYPGTRLYEKIGNSFFEDNDWTEENVKKYFDRQVYPGISEEDRQIWRDRVYKPFNKCYIRRSILTSNTLLQILKIFINKVFSKKK